MTSVSIIIPYIDEYDFLQEALASAVGQKKIDQEVIVVCNAPEAPLSFQVLKDAKKKVRFIHEPRSGSAYARNAGLEIANGQWVQFLDVDDLLLPEKIFHQLEVGEADAIVSPHVYRYLSGREEKAKWLTEDLWTGLLNSGLGSTSSMLWRREALIDLNGWNPGFSSHQEYELLFRMMMADMRIIPLHQNETIVRQRKHGSITSNSQPVRAIEGIRLREAIWHHLIKLNQATPERFEAFRQYIFKQLRGYFRRESSTSLFLYRKYFSEIPFTPKDMHIPGYNILFKILGFEKTESLLFFLMRMKKGREVQ